MRSMAKLITIGLNTCAKPVKTPGSKQRYNFERHDRVFSSGGYQLLNTSGFSSAYNLINKQE